MELKNLYEIWDRFDASSAEEMELDMNGVHFSLKKGAGTVNNLSAPKVVQTVTETVKESPKEEKGVTAPLVGTFYAAASPDSEPFVKVGSKVNQGDVVGIIEAMKLMNEVKANASGTVKAVLAEDGSLVEYGQLLVVLE